jgi:membrane protein required for colicin V production
MGIFDIIVGGISILAFLSGLRKGLISEVASLVSIILGIYGAIHFGFIVEGWINALIPTQHVGLVSFVVTVIIVIVIVHIVGSIINRVVGMTILSLPNRLGGGLLSVVKMLFFIGCIISMLDYVGVGTEIFDQQQRDESYIYPIIDQVRSIIYPYFEDVLNKI